MSIFGNIASAIFGRGSVAGTTAAAGSAGSATKGTAARAPGTAVTPLTQEQVEATIVKLAGAQHEKYNWKQSIVDLMKLLKLDSGLSVRKQLAQELGYKGELTGSAEMNIWLHKQVMQKLAESGGAVPESLKQGKSSADAAHEPEKRTTSIFGKIVSTIFGGRTAGTTASAGLAAPGTTAKPITQEQVEAMIAKLADAQHKKYNWKVSIVDLMKLLKLDSGLSVRKQLAQELGYKGELTGSAEMNIWLHKQVMQKLAESGGAVPESLKQGKSSADAAHEPEKRTTSIFGKIVSTIFGGRTAGTTASAGLAAPGTTAKPITQEQVEAMIAKLADAQHKKYNWKVSIVDLMKLLNLDSSLTARKQLAQELGYKGKLTGSAEMNIWLQKQVMQKLAESGGVVPDGLKHV
jgi:uncharacterized protein YjgD (DUF1641 family)